MKYTVILSFDANGIQGKPGQLLTQEDVDFIGVSSLEHLIQAGVIVVSEETSETAPASASSPVEHEQIIDEAGSDELVGDPLVANEAPVEEEKPKKKGKGKKK